MRPQLTTSQTGVNMLITYVDHMCYVLIQNKKFQKTQLKYMLFIISKRMLFASVVLLGHANIKSLTNMLSTNWFIFSFTALRLFLKEEKMY
jgi:hypothetical protein